MLNVKNLNFEYDKGIHVLNNISFDLTKGKTLAIVGASGCGKSTLLRMISGILPKIGNTINGKITINGHNPVNYRLNDKLSFMFQEPTLLPHLNVNQNIGFPLSISGEIDKKKVNDLINLVGLDDYETYLPKMLSGGMKTRVSLARSFVTSPELLLLDEPFTGLDIAWKSKLYIELEKLKQKTGSTIIIVTHDVQEALLLADIIIVMNNNGSIEMSNVILTKFSILERVNNITEYMNSVFENYLLPIQEAIINGQK